MDGALDGNIPVLSFCISRSIAFSSSIVRSNLFVSVEGATDGSRDGTSEGTIVGIRFEGPADGTYEGPVDADGTYEGPADADGPYEGTREGLMDGAPDGNIPVLSFCI